MNQVSINRSSTSGDYRVFANGTIELASTGRRMRFIGDEDGNNDAQVLFSWHEDDNSDGARLMQLNASNGGDLLIGGQLFPGTNFYLAEAFWAGEPLR